MNQPPVKTHTILPVLTEVADANTTDIPTLTEIHIAANNDNLIAAAQTEIALNATDAKTEPLSDAACQYLVAQITPQVEVLLQNAMRDIQAKLPELIRSALDKKTVDIIAPLSPHPYIPAP